MKVKVFMTFLMAAFLLTGCVYQNNSMKKPAVGNVKLTIKVKKSVAESAVPVLEKYDFVKIWVFTPQAKNKSYGYFLSKLSKGDKKLDFLNVEFSDADTGGQHETFNNTNRGHVYGCAATVTVDYIIKDVPIEASYIAINLPSDANSTEGYDPVFINVKGKVLPGQELDLTNAASYNPDYLKFPEIQTDSTGKIFVQLKPREEKSATLRAVAEMFGGTNLSYISVAGPLVGSWTQYQDSFKMKDRGDGVFEYKVTGKAPGILLYKFNPKGDIAWAVSPGWSHDPLEDDRETIPGFAGKYNSKMKISGKSSSKFSPMVTVTYAEENPLVGQPVNLNLSAILSYLFYGPELGNWAKEAKVSILDYDTGKEVDIASLNELDQLNTPNQLTKVLNIPVVLASDLKVTGTLNFKVVDKIDSALSSKLYTVKISLKDKNGETFDNYSTLKLSKSEIYAAIFDIKYATGKSSLKEGKNVVLEKQAFAFDASKSIGDIDEYEYIVRKDKFKKPGIITKKPLYGLDAANAAVTYEAIGFADNFGDYDVQLVVKKNGVVKATSDTKRVTVARKGYIRQVVTKDGKSSELNLKGSQPNTEVEILPYYSSPTQINGKTIKWSFKNKLTGQEVVGVSDPDPTTKRVKWTPTDAVSGNDYKEYSVTYDIYDGEKLQVTVDVPYIFLVMDKIYDEIKPVLPIKSSVQLMGDVTNFTPETLANDMTLKVGSKNIWEKTLVLTANSALTGTVLGPNNHADAGTYGASAPKPAEFEGLYRVKFTQEHKWDGVGQYGAGWWMTPEAELAKDFSKVYGDGIGELGDVLVYVGYKNAANKWEAIAPTKDKPLVGPILIETPGRGGSDNGACKLGKNNTYKYTLDLENWLWKIELIEEAKIIPQITITGDKIQGKLLKFKGENTLGNDGCSFKWRILKDDIALPDSIESLSDVTYTFAEPGDYEVELTVSKDGEKDQKVKQEITIIGLGEKIVVDAKYNSGASILFTAPTGYVNYNFIVKTPYGEKINFTGAKNTWTFTGIKDDNDDVIPGTYKVYVEVSTSDGTVIQSKETIVEVK